MQKIALLFVLMLAFAALAGCAENAGDAPGGQDAPGGDEGGASGGTPPESVSNEQALALFRSASTDLPERFGVQMVLSKDGKDLMVGDAVTDRPEETDYFVLRFDPSLADGQKSAPTSFSMLATPKGNAILVNGSVYVTEPGEGSNPLMGSAEENAGFATLMSPESLFESYEDQNVTVTSVTPTVLRGKGALKVETSHEVEGETQQVTVWLFQNPSRVARVESVVRDAENEQMDGATMVVDMLYDGDVALVVPSGLERALGLRYTSNRESFGGWDMGGDEDGGPEVWTFQVDGDIPLSEILVEVGEGSPMEEETVASWSMPLSEGSKSQDGVRLTFTDADDDGKLSANDSLTIERTDEALGAGVWLKDSVSGYRVVPGAGLVLGLLAGLGAALLLRRR